MMMEKSLGDEVAWGLVWIKFSGSLPYRGDLEHEAFCRESLTCELKSSHNRPGDGRRARKSRHKGPELIR